MLETRVIVSRSVRHIPPYASRASHIFKFSTNNPSCHILQLKSALQLRIVNIAVISKQTSTCLLHSMVKPLLRYNEMSTEHLIKLYCYGPGRLSFHQNIGSWFMGSIKQIYMSITLLPVSLKE